MLIFWIKLQVSENNLVTVNVFIERSPLLAKRVLDNIEVVRRQIINTVTSNTILEALFAGQTMLLAVLALTRMGHASK